METLHAFSVSFLIVSPFGFLIWYCLKASEVDEEEVDEVLARLNGHLVRLHRRIEVAEFMLNKHEAELGALRGLLTPLKRARVKKLNAFKAILGLTD